MRTDLWSVFTRPGSLRKQEQKQMAEVYSTLERVGWAQKGEEGAADRSPSEANMSEIGRQLIFSHEIRVISVYNAVSKIHHLGI